jgi:hypothetical protein
MKAAFPETGTDPIQAPSSNSPSASYYRCVLEGIVAPKALEGGLRLDMGGKGAHRWRQGKRTRKE